VYLGADGAWHGRVTIGACDDGRPDRRHVRGRTEAEVVRKVRKLERDRDGGKVRRAGRTETLGHWLAHWVENVAARTVRPKTLAGYRTAVNFHLIPGLGAHRLDKLLPDHIESFYTRLLATGRAPATVHQVHRTLRTALNEAVRRSRITSNPAQIAKSPRLIEVEIEPFSMDEARQLLDAAVNRRNGARWAFALSLGLRQGEALGLRWTDVDLNTGSLIVRRALQRHTWQHGCGGSCGRKRGADCPDRRGGGLLVVETKSRSGRRAIGLPPPLVELLREHRTAQDAERDLAGSLWQDGGWLFAQPNGKPTDPRADHREWKEFVRDAGVREARLHDARHTAATMLLVLGVPQRVVMDLMGWSHTAMTLRYQHVSGQVRHDIAAQVGGLLWARNETGTETTKGTTMRPTSESAGQ
jgi:integrase